MNVTDKGALSHALPQVMLFLAFFPRRSTADKKGNEYYHRRNENILIHFSLLMIRRLNAKVIRQGDRQLSEALTEGNPTKGLLPTLFLRS